MTALLTWAVIAAYLAGGLVFARNRLRHWHETDHYGMFEEGTERGMAVLGAVFFGLIWPLSMAFLLFRDWMWRPVDRQTERIQRLRAERDDWERKYYSGTEAEQAMAPDILATLNDLLRQAGR